MASPNFREDYHVTRVELSHKEAGEVVDFTLEPKAKDTLFDSLRLSFRNGVINDMQMVDGVGQRPRRHRGRQRARLRGEQRARPLARPRERDEDQADHRSDVHERGDDAHPSVVGGHHRRSRRSLYVIQNRAHLRGGRAVLPVCDVDDVVAVDVEPPDARRRVG